MPTKETPAARLRKLELQREKLDAEAKQAKADLASQLGSVVLKSGLGETDDRQLLELLRGANAIGVDKAVLLLKQGGGAST